MITLRAMTDDEFTTFKAVVIDSYADDIARNYHLAADEAHHSSAQQIEQGLRDGRATAGQELAIIVSEAGDDVGYLWVDVDETHHRAFLAEIIIHEAYRNQGYGRQTLDALEQRLRARGIRRIGLHVFGDNAVAQALYNKVGYYVTGLNMQKDL